MLNAAQIKATYPGYAGWNDEASIIADYKATGGSGKGNTPFALGQGNTANTASGNQSYSTSSSGGGYSTGQAATDIKAQYSNLLGLLKGQSDTATASEYGKRGIPTSSGIVQNAQTQNYANAAGNIQLQESRDLGNLASDPSVNSSSSSGGSGGSGSSSTGSPNWQQEQDQFGGGAAATNNDMTQQTSAAPGVQRLADGSPATLGFASQMTPSASSGISAQTAAQRAQAGLVLQNDAQQSATALNKQSSLLKGVLNLNPPQPVQNQFSDFIKALQGGANYVTNPLTYRAY